MARAPALLLLALPCLAGEPLSLPRAPRWMGWVWPALGAPGSSTSFGGALLDGTVPVAEREFLINGWRWHNRAVVHELSRFVRRVQEAESSGAAESARRLGPAYAFVFSFSWRALHTIETELFMPFLRERLPARLHAELAALERELSDVWELGERISKLPAIAASGAAADALLNGDAAAAAAGIAQASRLSAELESKARRVYSETELSLVPCVAAFVPRDAQEKFNGRVIRSLGVLPSRLHLACMAEAIAGDSAEELKFREQVPSVARIMLPHWRRTLYLPRTECLRPAPGVRAAADRKDASDARGQRRVCRVASWFDLW